MPRFAEPQTWYRVRKLDLEIKPVEVIGESEQYVYFAAVDGWRREHREAKQDSSGVIVPTVKEAIVYAQNRIDLQREQALRQLSDADRQQEKLMGQIAKWKEDGDA